MLSIHFSKLRCVALNTTVRHKSLKVSQQFLFVFDIFFFWSFSTTLQQCSWHNIKAIYLFTIRNFVPPRRYFISNLLRAVPAVCRVSSALSFHNDPPLRHKNDDRYDDDTTTALMACNGGGGGPVIFPHTHQATNKQRIWKFFAKAATKSPAKNQTAKHHHNILHNKMLQKLSRIQLTICTISTICRHTTRIRRHFHIQQNGGFAENQVCAASSSTVLWICLLLHMWSNKHNVRVRSSRQQKYNRTQAWKLASATSEWASMFKKHWQQFRKQFFFSACLSTTKNQTTATFRLGQQNGARRHQRQSANMHK